MYHKVGVQKLSRNQILKLLRGERIRVKHGNHHEIHASEEQHKKIITAHKKGAGTTIQFDPFQQQMESHHQLKGSHSHPVHTSHITHPHAHGEGARAKKAHRGRGEGFKEDAFRFLLPHMLLITLLMN